MQGESVTQPGPGASRTDRICLTLWASICISLFVLTWRLWIPGFTDFPRVPLVFESSKWLVWIQTLASIGIISALGEIAVRNRSESMFLAILFVGLGVTFVCNQHCLQAWAWQTFVFAILLWGMPRGDAKKWMGVILISIYLFSAISKFDFQFTQTTGKDFLAAACSMIGMELDPAADHRKVVALFPIGELLIGLGLMFSRTRKVTAVAAIVMHTCLIALLFKLQHHPPVIIWNAMQILLVFWLFWDRVPPPPASKPGFKFNIVRWFAIAVLLIPLLRPIGLCDHWMAWGLYSPSNSRALLELPPQHIDRLPENLQSLCTERSFGQTARFYLGQWSLQQLGAPIYPESRFQIPAARGLIQRYSQVDWQLSELGPSHPVNGRRQQKTVPIDKSHAEKESP